MNNSMELIQLNLVPGMLLLIQANLDSSILLQSLSIFRSVSWLPKQT